MKFIKTKENKSFTIERINSSPLAIYCNANIFCLSLANFKWILSIVQQFYIISYKGKSGRKNFFSKIGYGSCEFHLNKKKKNSAIVAFLTDLPH